MSNINLLPWRQELTDRLRKAFMNSILLCLAVGAGIAILIYIAFAYQIERQERRNTQLKSEIVKVDQKISEIAKLKEQIQQLKDRMNAINTLQQSRNIPVHLFSDLPTIVASGVYLNKMSMNGNTVSVNGLTEANTRLSSMIRNIDNSKWLGNGSITQTKAESKDGKRILPTLPDGLYEFNMQFSILGDGNNAKNTNNKKRGGK
jgi:type IV pilus assembly protein PilN